MNNTFRMSEIVLSVPALGIPLRNSDGSISFSGEHVTAHVYAVLDGNGGADHCGLYEYPRHVVAALSLYTATLPRAPLPAVGSHYV